MLFFGLKNCSGNDSAQMENMKNVRNERAAPPAGSCKNGKAPSQELHIRNVWQNNLVPEMVTINKLIETYKYVALVGYRISRMVLRPWGFFHSKSHYEYLQIKSNVDHLRLIQMGLTFLDENGDHPPTGPYTFQFNFKFNLSENDYARESIELLRNSGIDFDKHATEGIGPSDFAEIVKSAGLVLLRDIKWITFHCCYDFAYFIKILTNDKLPPDGSKFFELLKSHFGTIYNLRMCFGGQIDDSKFNMHLYQLGTAPNQGNSHSPGYFNSIPLPLIHYIHCIHPMHLLQSTTF